MEADNVGFGKSTTVISDDGRGFPIVVQDEDIPPELEHEEIGSQKSAGDSCEKPFTEVVKVSEHEEIGSQKGTGDSCKKPFTEEVKVSEHEEIGSQKGTGDSCKKPFTEVVKVSEHEEIGSQKSTGDSCEESFTEVVKVSEHEEIGSQKGTGDSCKKPFTEEVKVSEHEEIGSQKGTGDSCKKPFTEVVKVSEHEEIGSQKSTGDSCKKPFTEVVKVSEHEEIGSQKGTGDSCKKPFTEVVKVSEHEEIGSQKSTGDSCKESFTEENKREAKVRRNKISANLSSKTDFSEQNDVYSLQATGGLKELTNGESHFETAEKSEVKDGVETQGAVAQPPCDDPIGYAGPKEELKKFLESFNLPQQKQYENVDRPKEDKSARQLCRQISEEQEKEMKLIASHLGKTFLDKTVSEERVEVTDVKILEAERVDETNFKFGLLVEPLDSSITASENVSLHAQTETFEDRTTNKEDIWTHISTFGDGQQFEHYIKSHIDRDAFNWRIIDHVAEFLVLSLHVLFGKNRIQEIQDEGGDVEHVKHLDVCRELYQNLPIIGLCECGVDYINDWKKVGEIKRALYKQGEQGDYSAAMDKSGFEIALVKMDHEEKTSIEFTERLLEQWNKLDMGTELKFKGKCKHYHDIPLDSDVYKIGKQTGLTKGVITHKNEPYKLLNSVLHLLNQIVVKWENDPFSEPGDSGSMVFTVEKGEIISVGIVIGSVEEKKLSIVTPISEILDYFSEKNKAKYCRLKHFVLKTDGRTVKKII